MFWRRLDINFDLVYAARYLSFIHLWNWFRIYLKREYERNVQKRDSSTFKVSYMLYRRNSECRKWFVIHVTCAHGAWSCELRMTKLVHRDYSSTFYPQRLHAYISVWIVCVCLFLQSCMCGCTLKYVALKKKFYPWLRIWSHCTISITP